MFERKINVLTHIAVLMIGAFILAIGYAPQSFAQSNCIATSAAPSWVNNSSHTLSCDLSGNLRATGGGGGGGGTSSNFNAAFPTSGTAAGALDNVSGDMVPFTIDNATSGLNVNVVGGGGTGGTSSNFSAAFPATGTAAGASDGTSMVPLLVDGSGNLKVNVAAGGGSGGTSSNFSAAFPATGTAAGASNGTNMVPLLVDGSGNLKTALQTSIPAGANVIGAVTQSGTWNVGTVTAVTGITNPVAVTQSGTWTVQPGNTANTTPWLVRNSAATTGGATMFHLVAANTNNSTLISAGAHTVYSLTASNNSATIAYVKLYDKATAPTCGTDTPIAAKIIPASTSGAGTNIVFGAAGISVSLGLGICIVTGIADNDNTAVAASTYIVDMGYK